MGRSTQPHEWEQKVARAIGVGKVGWNNMRPSDTGIRGELTVPCSHGHDVVIQMPTKFPHDVVKKKLQHQGWEFHGRKPVCPECAEQERSRKAAPTLKVVASNDVPLEALQPTANENEREEVPVTATAPQTSTLAVASATEQTPSAKAKAAKRAVMTWLDEAFEITGPDVGRYKQGFSDASIAKETGCSEKAVADLREEFFGKIAKPRELDSIKVEVGNLLLAAGNLERTAQETAETIINNAKAEAKVIRDKATALTDRLNKIAAANGWAA